MKVCIILTGGTIMTEKIVGTAAYAPIISGKPGQPQARIKEIVPELEETAEISCVFLFHEDSANFSPLHWVAIGRAIYDRYYDYDGFVVITGTDTMAYTASALSFALEGLGKPVILTGSQAPIAEIGSDGRRNLINAVRIATMDLGEVAILFGTKLIRGTRSKKISEFDMEGFTSLNFPFLGEIGLDIEFSDWEEKRHTGSISFCDHFEENVGLIKLYPGIRPDILDMMLFPLKGAVIEGFGAGNIPAKSLNLVPVIEKAIQRGAIIVVGTQCLYGNADSERYVGSLKTRVKGAISAYDMTSECALTKLMWVLGATRDPNEIRMIFTQDLVGEMRPVMDMGLVNTVK